MNIETQREHYRLKGLLNQISHISYTYSQLQKHNRSENLTEDEMVKINLAFTDLIKNVSIILNNEKNQKSS